MIIKNGLPGSGHTHPDHPVYDWVAPRLTAEQLQDLKAVLDNARIVEKPQDSQVTTIAEVQYDESDEIKKQENLAEVAGIQKGLVEHQWLVWSTIAGLILAGVYRGRQKPWEKN